MARAKGLVARCTPSRGHSSKKREMRRVKTAKKAKTADVQKEPAVDTSNVVLEGESTDKVEVYDTCDEIRRNINAHQQKSALPQAQFLRDIAAQYHTSDKTIQSKQLGDLRSKKGAYSGNTSSVFYGVYIFFEKIRVKEGKLKSKTRLEMERRFGAAGGMELDREHDTVWLHVSETASLNKYGELKIGLKGPKPYLVRKRRILITFIWSILDSIWSSGV